eukprot:CAMPEP_0119300066 /NCGR_PEP_ID=MMETSP1333-20130426/2069_1 /TAXON_ID=418940 /ORGANISM="Scyphosphaera apsteinii, Strain RCC1455" /LENGTH=321 /DNA_ID=CAMNT_0007301705 /DNA_START=74 /DNA_END=1039 /DNA_ORIENTATION=-
MKEVPASHENSAIRHLAGWLLILLIVVSAYRLVRIAMKATRVRRERHVAACQIQGAVRAKIIAVEAGKALMLCRLIQRVRIRDIAASRMQVTICCATTQRQAFLKHRSAVILLQSNLRAIKLRKTFLKQRSAAMVLQAQIRGAAARAWFAPAAMSISLLKNIKWTPRRASVASKLRMIARPTTAEHGWSDRISRSPSISGSASPTGGTASSPETGLWLARIEQSVGRVENLLKSEGIGNHAGTRAVPLPPPPPPLPPSQLLQPPLLKANERPRSESFATSETHGSLLLQLKAQLSARRSSLDSGESEALAVDETPLTASIW